MRGPGAIIGLLSLAACDREPPAPSVYDQPLARWRSAGVDATTRVLPDGHVLSLPAGDAVMCMASSYVGGWDSCSVTVSRVSWRAIGYGGAERRSPMELRFELEPNGYEAADTDLNETTLKLDRMAVEGGVAGMMSGSGLSVRRAALAGRAAGRRYHVLCGSFVPGPRRPFAHGCKLTADLGAGGSAELEFETQAPPGDGLYRLDAADYPPLVAGAAAIRASFDGTPDAVRMTPKAEQPAAPAPSGLRTPRSP